MAFQADEDSSLFSRVEKYDWENDQEFQGGLRAILGSATSSEQIEHLTLRARCFYYSRKFGTKVDFNGYQTWRRSDRAILTNIHGFSSFEPANNAGAEQSAPTDTPASPQDASSITSGGPRGDAPTPASFADICQLIAEGKPIPGIREVPDTVLEGQATASSVPRRKKPWEKGITVTEGRMDETSDTITG